MGKNKVLAWRHSPIDPELFIELTKKSDAKALAHLLPHMGLIIVLALASYRAFTSLPLYLSIPIYFVFTNVLIFIGLCSGLHEMTHGTVFKTKALNTFFMRFIAFFTWGDYVFYRTSHMKHHQYTAHHGLEMEVELPMHLEVPTYLYSLIGNPYFTLRTMKDIFRRARGKIEGQWEEMIFPSDQPKKRHELILWDRTLIVGHLIIALTIVMTGHYLLLLYITFPMLFSSIASYAITLTQHTGLQADVADSRKCCRSVKVNPVYEFLYWHMNYHIEHHMYAAVPFYNLKKLSRAIARDLPERKSMYESYKEMIRIQQRQKLEPDYYYQADCPE